MVGRTKYDISEVDSEVLISSYRSLNRDDIVTVKITGAEDDD
ncbi:hypothetical protein [uncultured Draconibacterium sp.]